MELHKNSLEFLYFIHFQENHTFTDYQKRMGISYLYKCILCQKILSILLGTVRAIFVGQGQWADREEDSTDWNHSCKRH